MNEYIVKDYLAQRLQSTAVFVAALHDRQYFESLRRDIEPSTPSGPTNIVSTIRAVSVRMKVMANEFERQYKAEYEAYVNQDVLAKPMFFAVINEMYNGVWKWSRVVALFGFSGIVADFAASQFRQQPDRARQLIRDIASWTIEILESPDAKNFFENKGGWDGFAIWSSSTVDMINRSESEVPLKKQFAIVGLVAAAFAGLSVILNRIV